MSIKLAINGFGRIGRLAFRATLQSHDIEVVGINDLTDAGTLAHLLKYDSIHGRFPGIVQAAENAISVNGREIRVLAERDPAKLPWAELGADVVLECTGLFRKRAQAAKHLSAGAKRVIISAPSPDADLTLVYGVNNDKFDASRHEIISNGSCTTNCLAPVVKVLHREFGILCGLMTTIHAYTNDQRILDFPHSDLRRARAAALSMIPTSTGAAKAICLVIPELEGKLNGLAIRVPTPNVSVVDFVCTVEKEASVEAVNAALSDAAAGPLAGVLAVTSEPLVSCDFNGSRESGTVDLGATMVSQGKMLKVLCWYDNENGFSYRMIDVVKMIAG